MLKLARRTRDLALEGKRARQYDAFSRRYRSADLEAYARMAADLVPDGGSVLDVATGPGHFCIELAKLGGRAITGVDISADAVALARTNAAQTGVAVELAQGNASALPFPDACFDLVFCSWALKNFREPAKALREMHRVLRPGGTALVIDLNRDATGRDWKEYSSRVGLSGATALAMTLAFWIQRSGAYSRAQLDALIASTPFRESSIRPMGVNLCVQLRG